MARIRFAMHSPAYRPSRAALPERWVLTDGGPVPDRLPNRTGVILRGYDRPDRAALAQALGIQCKRRGLPLLIAGDWRLARAVGASGIHLPEWLLRRPALWRRAQPGWIVTAATHTYAALHAAAKSGVDGALISPVFATRSHPDACPLGPLRLGSMLRFAAQQGCSIKPEKCSTGLAIYALGGMTEKRFQRLAPLGIYGWAGIGAFEKK